MIEVMLVPNEDEQTHFYHGLPLHSSFYAFRKPDPLRAWPQEFDAYILPSNRAAAGRCPKLIARSSTYSWVPPYHKSFALPLFTFLMPRRLEKVGDHKIYTILPELTRALTIAVGSLQWVHMEFVRLEYYRPDQICRDSKRLPTGEVPSVEQLTSHVVLLIKVMENSCAPERGLNVVRNCHHILELRGIVDVECQIQENGELSDRGIRLEAADMELIV